MFVKIHCTFFKNYYFWQSWNLSIIYYISVKLRRGCQLWLSIHATRWLRVVQSDCVNFLGEKPLLYGRGGGGGRRSFLFSRTRYKPNKTKAKAPRHNIGLREYIQVAWIYFLLPFQDLAVYRLTRRRLCFFSYIRFRSKERLSVTTWPSERIEQRSLFAVVCWFRVPYFLANTCGLSLGNFRSARLQKSKSLQILTWRYIELKLTFFYVVV